MRVSALCFSLLLCSIAQGAFGQTEPKPLMFLDESDGWGTPIGPNPYGLRLVLYDDGKLIFSEDTIDAMRSDAAPKFKLTKLTASAAVEMADSVRAKLDGVPTEISGDSDVTDLGWTTIQVWSDADKGFRRYDAYGHPCLAKGRLFPDLRSTKSDDKSPDAIFDAFDTLNRRGTDPRFLDVCDALSQFSAGDAAPWEPRAMWVFLASEAVENEIAWPPDWPRKPANAERATLCVPISNGNSDITRRMRTGKNEDQRFLDSAGVKQGDGRWWSINYWTYAFPGEIRLSGTEDSYWPIARGPCKLY
jgi:hypothetical protein